MSHTGMVKIPFPWQQIKKNIIFAVTIQKQKDMRKTSIACLLMLAWGMMACGGRNSNETEIPPATNSGTDTIVQHIETPATDLPYDKNATTVKAASTDTMLMVLDYMGRVVGRYVRTNETSYTVCVKDEYEVPKDGREVVMFRAVDGKGILYTRRTNVIIRQQPTTASDVMTMISTPKGNIPETYPCLGKSGDWYKIIVKGKEGYVRQDLVIWDGMSSF